MYVYVCGCVRLCVGMPVISCCKYLYAPEHVCKVCQVLRSCVYM